MGGLQQEQMERKAQMELLLVQRMYMLEARQRRIAKARHKFLIVLSEEMFSELAVEIVLRVVLDRFLLIIPMSLLLTMPI